MISVLQASAWYPPGHVGGTEIYLSGLVRELRAFDVVSRIIAPLAPDAADGYAFEDATVRTYPVNPVPSRAELRGDLPHAGFDRFRRLLADEHPEIYHQHSWTRGLGAIHLHAAREAGLKTVLTVHTPDNICLRGTMMRFGREACDGRIDLARCAACRSHDRGASMAVAQALGALPTTVSKVFERTLPEGRFATALSARALAERRSREFARMVADADRIVAVSGWLLEALARNGVAADKLVLSRQGIDRGYAAEAAGAAAAQRREEEPYRLVFLGRWHPVKGIDFLVRAVRAIPLEVPLTLTIHAVGDGPEEQAYADRVRRLAAGDPRIAIAPPVPRAGLASVLAQASALAVPSLCLETGPLVVLEARAIGLPVIGSRLGGIAELVDEPNDGVLLPPGDAAAWTAAIIAAVRNSGRRTSNAPAAPVRTMREAAQDMAALYASLCRVSAPRVGVMACG